MKLNRWVKWWLLTGLFMLFIQVVVGGITRITGSGLSITEWDIVTGTLPPMTDAKWESEFQLYKETPQYREINEGMKMGSIFQGGTFKFIYFWEWIHRFWARIMGFVFLIPLCFFLIKKWVSKSLGKDLTVVFLLAVLAASFGWIMVASGLIERPWVNAYKLAMHLSIAFSVYGYLLWTYLKADNKEILPMNTAGRLKLFRWGMGFGILLCIQIFLGGVMSGMKAGVFYPTWPDMNGVYIPQLVFDSSQWTVENFNQYDQNLFVPALFQLLHRTSAYVLFIVGVYIFYMIYRHYRNTVIYTSTVAMIIVLVSQVLLGIITVVNCKTSIPLLWGVLHQAFALFLLSAYLNFIFRLKQRT